MKPVSGVVSQEIYVYHMTYQDNSLTLVCIADSHNQYWPKVLSDFET